MTVVPTWAVVLGALALLCFLTSFLGLIALVVLGEIRDRRRKVTEARFQERRACNEIRPRTGNVTNLGGNWVKYEMKPWEQWHS